MREHGFRGLVGRGIGGVGSVRLRPRDPIRATRVAALAGPGEVLVSSTVKDLVAGSGLRFNEHGTHSLKGVPGEWRLFTVASS